MGKKKPAVARQRARRATKKPADGGKAEGKLVVMAGNIHVIQPAALARAN